MENEFIDKEGLEALEEVQKEKKRKEKERKERRHWSKRKKNSKVPGMFVQILNGDFLSKEFVLGNLGFILFVMFLLLLTVGKGYYGKQLSKDVDEAQKELDEMTADYVEAKARMEEETRRYRLVQQLGPRGLVESEDSTKVIRLKKVE